MRNTRFSFTGIWVIIAAMLLTACAPGAVPTPAASSGNPVPLTAATATNAASPAATTSATTQPASSGGGAGVTYVIVPAKSEASYQVREQLARLNFPSDAVGKTNAISGQITLNPDGSVDAAKSKFTVDLSTLQSDSQMRDNFVRRNILLTDQNPQAVFVPTQISGLPAAIPQNGSVAFKVTGNLTVNNVTKPVTWDVTGSTNNGEATGTATTSFTFEDFNLQQPRVPAVLSVVDKIMLNVNIALQRSGG